MLHCLTHWNHIHNWMQLLKHNTFAWLKDMSFTPRGRFLWIHSLLENKKPYQSSNKKYIKNPQHIIQRHCMYNNIFGHLCVGFVTFHLLHEINGNHKQQYSLTFWFFFCFNWCMYYLMQFNLCTMAFWMNFSLNKRWFERLDKMKYKSMCTVVLKHWR